MASGHLQRTSCSRYGCLSRLYGEGNVIQGGGNSLQIKEPVTASIEESRAGNSASHFGEYAASEQALIAEGESAGKGNVTAQADKLATQAQQDLIAEINKFPSKTQATNTSTMIGAYDPITGKTAVGSSNAAITADALHPTTVAYIEKQLGVKIGEFTSFCKNKAGACAEVSGADALIRQGAKPENIKFTQALRPREVWQKETIPPKAIVETCENCGTVWPNGAHK